MEIKRNIFESSRRMPARSDNVGPPLESSMPGVTPQMSGVWPKVDVGVQSAPSPRIGEQK